MIGFAKRRLIGTEKGLMKQLFSFLLGAGLLSAVAVEAAPPSPDLMAQVHFAGAGQISADTNAVAFTIFGVPPGAGAPRPDARQTFPRALRMVEIENSPRHGDGAAQIRPLLDDLLSAEWFLQIRDATNGSPEFALAIRLNADRAQLWRTNLATVMQLWKVFRWLKTRPAIGS